MILPNFLPYMAHDTADQDIKRILIDRDITTLKQAFCRHFCSLIVVCEVTVDQFHYQGKFGCAI